MYLKYEILDLQIKILDAENRLTGSRGGVRRLDALKWDSKEAKADVEMLESEIKGLTVRKGAKEAELGRR